MAKTISLIETYINTNQNSVQYLQVADKSLDAYFTKPLFVQYEFDLLGIPESILNIPYVANLYPICWFMGATLKVKSLDKAFFESIQKIKQEFAKYYPEILAKNSQLLVENIEANHYDNSQSAMLFSGGVDALYTYSRLDSKTIELATIHGVDIEINNTTQWHKIQDVNQNLQLTKQNPKHFLRSNLRDFYGRKVEKLIYGNTQDWWSYIQHGLALTTLLAPIAYKNGFGKVYIASTLDDSKNSVLWGSSYIDNFIAWGDTTVIYHGQESNRFNKMRLLCDYFEDTKSPTPFRVCYHPQNTKINCSQCIKCYRAILSLIVLGKDPRVFGFEIPSKNEFLENFYNTLNDIIKTQVSKQAVCFYWLEIYYEMISLKTKPFVFYDEGIETTQLKSIKNALTQLEIKHKSWKTIRRGFKKYIRTSWFKIRNLY